MANVGERKTAPIHTDVFTQLRQSRAQLSSDPRVEDTPQPVSQQQQPPPCLKLELAGKTNSVNLAPDDMKKMQLSRRRSYRQSTTEDDDDEKADERTVTVEDVVEEEEEEESFTPPTTPRETLKKRRVDTGSFDPYQMFEVCTATFQIYILFTSCLAFIFLLIRHL
ncbi:uncharacterized protein [Littorina saxatilis]|uniref:uncharacterized protein n=1 Tax=Littorina saxatilis TaxID=31220 RepID=UPI0038B5F67D